MNAASVTAEQGQNIQSMNIPTPHLDQNDVEVISEFVNNRGNTKEPYLIAVLENGKNPRFCLNVDGVVRSCRQNYASLCNMELLLSCTKGGVYKCKPQ